MIKKIALGLLLAVSAGHEVSKTSAQVVINELMNNPSDACDGSCMPSTSEWTELMNSGNVAVDISCYIMTDGDWSVTFPQGTILQPGQLFTIGSANSGITNLDLNIATCGCTSGMANNIGVFTNNNEQLVLANPSGIVVHGVYWGNGQFVQTPSFTTNDLFGCGAVTVNLSIDDPAISQIVGSNSDGQSFSAQCDGSGILSSGDATPTAGLLNFSAQALVVNASIQNEICPNTGSIDLTPSGNGPYEYAWQDALSGSTSGQVSGLTAGTWTVEIIDNGQCGYSEFISFDVLDQSSGCVLPDSSVLDGNSSVLLLCSEGGSAYITDNGGANGNMTAQPGQSYQSLEICSDSWDVNSQLTLSNWVFNFNGLSGDLFMVYAGPFSEIEQYMGNNPATLLTSPAAQNVVFNSMNSPVGADSTLVVSDTCYTLITYHIPGFVPSPGFEAVVTCIEPLSCLLDLSPIIVNDCDTANQIYSIDFDIVLNNTVNDVYQVALSLDGIAVDTVDVLSGEVFSYTMSGISVDAGANHVVFAEVLGSPGCNTEELYESVGCLFECNTLAGTGITGPTSRLLCFGQNQSWSATGEVVPSADVNDPNINYNPGMAWAIFSDMPTIFSGNVTADPAYAGIWPASISAIDGTYPFNFNNNTANGGAINNILTGNSGYPAPLHFYVAPVTLYDQTTGTIYVPGACSSIGDVVEITIVPAINYVLPTSNCQDGTVIYNPTQGNPAVNQNYFQLSGLTPNTVFATPIGNLTNGADLTIGGLVNGDAFSFTLTDTLGCAITVNGGPFVGDQTPSSPGVPEICQSSDPVQLQATPAGGVWSGPGVDANGIFDPDLVGTFGSFTVTYTTAGDCGGAIDIVVPVLTNDNCVEGEVIGIGEPLVIACGGFLTDDGLQPSDYSPNSNDTSVVCPDPAYPLPQITALDFNVFDLGFGDQLSIYNGDNANATLIGTFTGADIQNQSFYSTDPSGCLTVVFTSDADASVGNFSAEISCGIPCINPAVVVTTSEGPAPARICQQGEITFNASATEFFNDGIYESHIWEFGDGTVDTTSWPIVDHTFDAEGGYMVQLYVTDTNGCTNSVLIDYLVFVSTTPVIQLATSEADNKICTGVPLSLLSNFNEVNWSNVPTNPIDGFLFIPDDQSQCFSDTITFQGFPGNPVISSVNDIVDVFLNFEHSYMGDINITITCPDGSSVVLHNNGGAGTLLGQPVDNDADLTPGVGFDYTWTPQSTNGTWVQNAGGTLPAGDYEPVEPFTNLLGCPINGDWILEICDVLGSDNGYVFDWNVHFPEEFYPDTISFTPVIGMACDSSYWTTSNNIAIANPGGECDSIDVIVNAASSNTYIYHVIDNHGCEYTDEITVEFYAAPVVAVDPLINYCNTTLQLPNADSDNPLTNPAQGITYSYTWTSDSLEFLSATNIPNPTLTGLTPFVVNAHQVQYNVLVTSNQDPECFASDSLLVNVPPLLVPGAVMVDTVLCQGDEFELNYPYSSLSDSYVYTWTFSPDLGQVDTVGYESSYTIPSLFSTTYTLEVIDEDCNYVDYYYYTVLGDPCTITTYNIFTPNGNINQGENNAFVIGGLYLCDEDENCVMKFPGSVLKVYNRWGTLVYENENYDNTWTGEGLAEGTYYYVFLQNFDNQEDKYFHGDVYITR
jgi:subtilisin-like proprotein convertase family protein